MAFDLGTMKAQIAEQDEGIDVPIYGLDREPTGWTIKVVGRYSERFRKAQDAENRKLAKRTRRDAEVEARAYAVAVYGAAIIGWAPVEMGGKPFVFSPENAKALLEQNPPILDQVQAAVDDYAGFFKASSAS